MLLRFSPPKSSKLSPANCPVPEIDEVVGLAQRFQARAVSVRPSSRSLSRWVCVCSFASEAAANNFKVAAAKAFFGCAHTYLAVRQVGRRWRVSVPCTNPPLFACDRRCVLRVGGRRFLVPGVFTSSASASASVAQPFGATDAGVDQSSNIPATTTLMPTASELSEGFDSVAKIINEASVIGFSGSRRPAGRLPVEAIAQAISAVHPCTLVNVGCATGVDAYCRLMLDVKVWSKLGSSSEEVSFGRVRVFVANPDAYGVSAFARRSIACVEACAGGLWVSFPCTPCPQGLIPSPSSSSCFCGTGSGSWASLAYAVGIGIKCLVFLGDINPPSGWGFISLGNGWFIL